MKNKKKSLESLEGSNKLSIFALAIRKGSEAEKKKVR